MDADAAPFLKVLDPADNSTGGGTASAVAGSMAAALVAMVARLSLGRPGSDPGADYGPIAEQGQALAQALLAGGRKDADAFEAVRAAYRLPKANPEQKVARSLAIQAATAKAARVPLENAQRCRRVLGLAAQLEGRSNPNAASDLECARHLARAGLLGCAANVRINLAALKDPAIVTELAAQVEELLAGAGQAAQSRP
jgi:formiminotetrahydrofolate cyclodeaminase